MSENTNNLKLNGLRNEIRDSVKTFTGTLKEKLGNNLQSITIVASSLTDDFVPGRSDINTVVVLEKQTFDSLKTIASMAKAMSKKKISAPLLMTPEHIERSRDVFGIELLNFQLTHQTILGEDPFAELAFAKTDVRLQCERELKAMLIRLRQGYIAAAANKKLVRDILTSAAGSLIPLLQAMLWLKDIERPSCTEPVFAKAAEDFSIEPKPFVMARKLRHKKTRPQESDITAAFESIYSAVDQLAVIVDQLEV
jgi:hypothetical protein